LFGWQGGGIFAYELSVNGVLEHTDCNCLEVDTSYSARACIVNVIHASKVSYTIE